MAFEHPSGLPAAYDRAGARPKTSAVIFREGNAFISQAAELNEAQSLLANRARRISDRTIKDGDRIEGADAFVDVEAGTVRCLAGKIYVEGDILPVAEATLEDVPMTGETVIGVRVTRTTVLPDDDATLRGLHPGTAGEGEDGAARWEVSIAWGRLGDGAPGELYGVYLLLDGTIVTQAPPPALSGITEQLSRYDFDANGHYIVDGCEVTALGLVDGTKQLFSVAAGTANVRGFKRIRETAFSVLETEAPDLEPVVGESHIFTGATGGSTTVAVNRGPIAELTLAIVVKRVTQSIVRGAVPGGLDALDFPSAIEIEEVKQGATVFGSGTYALSAGYISWGAVGAEPAGASTYDVTYLYNAPVLVSATHTADTVTVTGGVNGKPITLGYTSKVPRIDIIGLDITGRPKYIKGLSARQGGLAPFPPSDILKLAEVHNDWFGAPRIENNGTRNYTYDEQRRLFSRLVTMLDQFERNSASYEVLASNPVSKEGIFTDTFTDDFYRDQGEPQTAAVNRGVLQLAIDSVMLEVFAGDTLVLPFAEEVVISQTAKTSQIAINPYANFNAFPAGLTLEPAVDFWTEQATEWTSPVTQNFTAAPNLPPGTQSYDEVAATRLEAARFLRQIPVTITLDGFGAGENLATLTFDGRNVKPAGVQTADGNGQISLTFNIPANVPVGARLVRAEGAAGSFAEAIFVGEGVIDVAIMRRVTLVAHAAPVPVVINNITNITQVTQTVVRQTSSGGNDPLAQTFRVPTGRLVTGVNFWLAALGNRANGVRVQLVPTANGFPTGEILAEAFISMATPNVGDKLEARFGVPVYCSPLSEYAFVILTADAAHAVKISRLGDVYDDGAGGQARVSSQPYTIGELLTSSNRITWLPSPDADLAFEIVAAKFTSATRTVDLWTGELDAISDVLVRGAVEIPTAEAGFRYELVRASGQVIPLAPGQSHEFAEYVSEEVTLRAVLTGTPEVSPILYPGTMFAGGRIRTTGTYVTKVFPMGAAVDVAALFAAFMPAGATIGVDVDKADDDWQAAALGSTGVLGGGWVEPKYSKAAFTSAEGRVRITLNGGPDKRLSIAKLRAYSI